MVLHEAAEHRVDGLPETHERLEPEIAPPGPGRDEASACQGGTTSVARSSRGGTGDPRER